MPESAEAKKHIDRFKALEGGRGVWDGHWEDLARVMLPRRMGFSSVPAAGDKRTEDLFDGSPMQAARGLANAMGGMLRPDGRKFFFLKTADDADERTDEAKDWLADAEERLTEAFLDPRARFRQATGECDLDLVVFGTGCIFMGEGTGLNHLLLQSIHLKDAYPYFDDDGNAAGLYRRRMLKVRQAVMKFGLGKVSDEVRQKYNDGKYEDEREYLHCVTPREEGRADAVMARNFPYTDLWIDTRESAILLDGGFRDFPFIVPRWDTSSGEDYGRSPGMIALPDANTLQAMGETLLVAGQRAADPPLAMPFDGFFTEVNTFPGGIVYYDVETAAKISGGLPIRPIETGANMPLSRDMQHDRQEQVMRAFLRNIFNLPVDGPEMTATEVMQRKEEFLREIGPVFGRLETDYTAPMVERGFKLMLRAGALPPIPPALQGRGVRFEYESPVKRIRQQVEARAAELWAQQQITFSTEAQRPEIIDVINFDALAAFTHEAAGLPHGIMHGADEVAASRQQRAQAQQTMQQMQAVQQAAESAGAAAPALKVLQGNQAA